MIKVISVIHFPEYGGPHNQSGRLAEPLRRIGVESISVLPDGPGAERIEAMGGQTIRLELGRFRASSNFRIQARMLGRIPIDLIRLRRILKAESPDLVQLNGLVNPHAAFAARSLGIPVVWQLLDTRPPMKLRKVMRPFVNTLADVVMPVGAAVALAHPGIDPTGIKSVIFHPPVDPTVFTIGTLSSLRQELGIEATAPVVGCVANVNPQKGYETFVESASLILRRVPNAVFVAAGHIYPNHREYRDSLGSRATQLGLIEGRNLFFLDSRSDIPNVLAAFDVFVLPSVPNSEGTPTAILEAMSTGLPIVASNIASIPEIVIEGENGFLVTPGDVQAFADSVAELLERPELARAFGERSRQLVLQRFSIDRCVEAHMKAYRIALNQRPVPDATCPTSAAPDARSQKSIQSAYYDDDADPDFEISRPHGLPILYRQMMDEKFRRSIAGFPSINSRSALTTCGGSGMDAEFLSKAGASVFASDLSMGAVARAYRRFGQYLDGLSMPAVLAADAEHLPFPDSSIDLVYVHDGLHHLEDPSIGLREMCRVASWAVSISEPADAALTGIAVKLGRAEEIEDAGNRVARLDIPTVTRILESEGFTVVRAQRYAMYYKHKPGWVMRILSLPLLNSAAWLSFDIGNFLIGRWGNKMTVQAIRTEHIAKAPPTL